MTDFVPASVKAASARSDELIKRLNKAPEADNPAKEEPGKTDIEDTIVDPNAAKKPEQTDNPDKPTPPDSQPNDFETKYRTLQGKYNAEIPRLNDQVRTLTSEIAYLSDENASLKAGKNNNDNSNSDTDSRLNPDFFDEYGEEFSSMAAKVNRLIDENDALKKQLGNVSQSQGRADYDRYINAVASEVQKQGVDFNKLNADPDFLTWLQDTIPYTGQPRHASLAAAEKRLDVSASVGIFNEYLGLNPSFRQQKPKVPSRTATPNLQPGHNPTRSDTSPPTSSSQTIWTRDKVNQMYKDKAAGRWRGKDAEFKALEADMFAAQTEGRFR